MRENGCPFFERVRLVFFFSSRRRHTRSKRDWSSDVCSSDLDVTSPSRTRRWRGRADSMVAGAPEPLVMKPLLLFAGVLIVSPGPWNTIGRTTLRSEERRVGKEI